MRKLKKFKSLEDLKPYKLVDFLGNGWSTAFMKEGYNINRVPKLEQIPQILASKRAEMLINSSNWINWWADKKGVSDEIVEVDNTNIFFSRFHFVLMVSRKSPWIDKELIRAMDEELIKMKKSGKWMEILKKYKDPYADGKPFETELNTDKFYTNYYNYPIYRP